MAFTLTHACILPILIPSEMTLLYIYYRKFRKLSRFPVILLATAAILANFSCATMLEGSKQKIRIHCEPSSDVIVVVDGEELSFNNGLIHLDKKREIHFVTLKKEGYYPSTLAFNRELNPSWFAADLIWLPAAPISWLTDWITASIYQLTPKDVNLVLREKGGEP